MERAISNHGNRNFTQLFRNGYHALHAVTNGSTLDFRNRGNGIVYGIRPY